MKRRNALALSVLALMAVSFIGGVLFGGMVGSEVIATDLCTDKGERDLFIRDAAERERICRNL